MTDAPSSRLSVVADIGGTNTRVALARGPEVDPGSIRRYHNADHPGFGNILERYVDDLAPGPVGRACVAVAGPVHDGSARLTNRDWSIDRDTIARPTGASVVAVLNDLQAQGHALGRIDRDHLVPVLEGKPAAPDAPCLVVGIGTGFNCAAVYATRAGRLVTASEAGHANMPIRSERDLSLRRFVETAHGFPEIEDVLSGRGLENIHAWLAREAGVPADRDAADIMESCRSGGDPLAVEAARIFVELFGTVAGNLALIHLPFGGVYLAGGVARAFTEHLGPFGFAEAFRNKGRFSGFMHSFSVSVIEDDYAALVGTAAHLHELG